MKEGITAKLCSQCNEYYAEALSALQRESVRQFWDREWVPLVSLHLQLNILKLMYLLMTVPSSCYLLDN